MNKIIKMLCLMLSVCLFSFPAFSEAVSNHELTERITRLEEQQKKGILPAKWAERITLSGAVEIEVNYEDMDFKDPGTDDEDSSDITLSTVELGIDVDIVKHVSGHVLFLWEEDDTEPVDLDEGFITIDGDDVVPIYLTVGKLYVPFGNFESNMISDPLTLELGETRESAVQVGFESEGFYGSVYVFNGDIDEDGDDNQIDNFGANAGYAFENDDFNLDISISYINNLMDSDGWSDVIAAELDDAEGNGFTFALRDYVPGFGAYAILNVGPFTMIGEYVTALDDPEFNRYDVVPGSLAGLGLGPTYKGEKPAAWNAELGYTFEIAGKETIVGAAYQGSDNGEDVFPEKRFLGVVGMVIFNHTVVSLEFLHDEFENDDERDLITAQLAIVF